MTNSPKTIATKFHLDLAHAHKGEDYWLRAAGKNHRLHAHSAETLAKLPAHLPERAPTHYTDAIDLPADKAMIVHVQHSARTLPGYDPLLPVPSICTLYIPPTNQSMAEQAISPKTTARLLAFCHPDLISTHPETAQAIWSQTYDNLKLKQMFDDLGSLIRKMGGPSLNPGQGWATLEHLCHAADPNVTAPDPQDPSKTVSYPGVNSYMVNPSADYLAAAGPVQTKLLLAIKNNTEAVLKARYWSVDYAQATIPALPANPPAGDKKAKAAAQPEGGVTMAARVDAPSGEEASDDWTVALTNTERNSGLKAEISGINPNSRSFSITFSDNQIRYLAYYAIFYDAEGNQISLKDWTPDGESGLTSLTRDLRLLMGSMIETDTVQFVGYSSGTTTVLGIPTVDGTLTLFITMPEGAVAAEFFGAGLGLSGSMVYPFSTLFGGGLTVLIDLVIPVVMLIWSASSLSNATDKEAVDKLLAGKWKFAAAQIVYYFLDAVSTWRSDRKLNWSDLISIAKVLFAPISFELLLYLEAKMAAEEAAEAVPFAGWVLFALQLSVGVVEITETVAEIIADPWQIPVGVKSVITTTVCVHPDPVALSYPYPSEAASLSVIMTYKQGRRPSVTATIPVAANHDAQDLLNAVFAQNTLGGQVRIDATYIVNNWVAAQASTGWIDNTLPGADNVTLYLVENPIPLDASSIYRQTDVLIYQDDAYAWAASNANPTATLAAANSAATGNAISVWRGLTLSQRYGALGYAWQAAGTGLQACDSTAGGQLSVMQNVNIPGTGMAGAAFPTCGFTGPVRLIYDPYPPRYQMAGDPPQYVLNEATTPPSPIPDPTDTSLGDYYLDPRSAGQAGGPGVGYHLRWVDLSGMPSGSVSFDTSSGQSSYGYLTTWPASMAMHPQGFVVAVDSQTCKLSILEISPVGVPDIDAPIARDFAGAALAEGRIGLLFRPVAVACSGDGTILVLEDTKGSSDDFANVPAVARLQAFDVAGNSVACFRDGQGQPSAVLALQGVGDFTYLDACAVGDSKLTYVFVLYYTGNGHDPAQYGMSIYQYGTQAGADNPLVTTNGVAAAGLAVDVWHQMYTLNYAMTTNAAGQPAGPLRQGAGPAGSTVPALGQWLPPIGSTG